MTTEGYLARHFQGRSGMRDPALLDVAQVRLSRRDEDSACSSGFLSGVPCPMQLRAALLTRAGASGSLRAGQTVLELGAMGFDPKDHTRVQ